MKLIPLSQGYEAMVDDDMYDYLMQWKWSANIDRTTVYARRNEYIGGKYARAILMHNVVMGINPGEGLECDHIDRNGLNDQRENLRAVTPRVNKLNTRIRVTMNGKPCSSHYRGVSWDKSAKRWRANISVNGKMRHLGMFDSEVEAALAYDRAAWALHGENAQLNFGIPDLEQQVLALA